MFMLKEQIVEDKNTWNRIIDSFKSKDIYFTYNYFAAYANDENGKPVLYYMECDYGKVAHTFMLRDIANSPNFKGILEENKYFDIISAYGYGGPIVESESIEDKEKLIEEFEKRFTLYCKENNIISEFIRFHPILKNYLGFENLYNTAYLRKTLATNLQDYGDPLYGEFSKSCRKKVNKCKRLGMVVQFDFPGKTLETFYEVYYSTMDRNDALEFYYFDLAYFKSLINNLRGNIFIANVIYEDRIIASGIYMHYDKFIHAHLSGTLSDYLKYSPANILRAEVANWGHKNGKQFFHHGGGYTNSEKDGLYRFKKSFSKNTNFDYYVGKKIWDQKLYQLLTIKAQEQFLDIDKDFFPTYRFRR